MHRLRTTVRRLEVQLPGAPARTAKSLKSLRRKAGKVRDIDVHLALLEPPLLPQPSAPRGDGPALPAAPPAAALEGAQQELRQLLKARRVRHLVSLRHRVSEAASLLAASLPGLVAAATRVPASAGEALQQTALARQQFLQWTHVLPVDAGRLHQLRIQTKKLRYLLEPFELHPEAVELAAKFKQVQDAIGSWHDWATLLQFAGRALKSPDAALLRAALQVRAASQFRQARHTVQSVRSALNGGKRAASGVGADLPQRMTKKAG